MSKSSIYFMGLITLLGFPLLGCIVNYFYLELNWLEFFGFQNYSTPLIILGACFGLFYAMALLLSSELALIKDMPDRVEKMVASLNLNLMDGLFLSVCASVGEELFFRAAIQPIIGPWWGALFFVAVHGYIVPWDWNKSKYGLVVLPLSILLSLGFDHFGLWFSIGVHFAYDFVLFESIRKNNN
ncbi:MAG: CPBP family intramembrane metalloprotease [Bacteroidetes bacterium]|nr:CPBP family intramembrane metalloprotease [Bacteroidota bacterium]